MDDVLEGSADRRNMKDKIAELADTMYSDLSYDGGPSYAWFEELADAILALEVPGKCLCVDDYSKIYCLNYEHTGCSGDDSADSCDRSRPTTIGDLTGLE